MIAPLAAFAASMALLEIADPAAGADGLARSALACVPWLAAAGAPDWRRPARPARPDGPVAPFVRVAPAAPAERPVDPAALAARRVDPDALAARPVRSASRAVRRNGAVALWLALALPVLGLALGLDRAAGRAPAALALGGLAFLALAALARARAAAAGAAGGAVYALTWLAVVPGGPALAFALSNGGSTAPPGLARALAELSPAHWLWQGALAGGAPRGPWLAALGALALLAAAERERALSRRAASGAGAP